MFKSVDVCLAELFARLSGKSSAAAKARGREPIGAAAGARATIPDILVDCQVFSMKIVSYENIRGGAFWRRPARGRRAPAAACA
ncbi:MAG: hypothetical protein BGP06_07020 [Rhizobiales bacterium 65-9]|nr:MAG: hypothetical protein BGP06_07020 [Rhizobiales bacterium 65-9]